MCLWWLGGIRGAAWPEPAWHGAIEELRRRLEQKRITGGRTRHWRTWWAYVDVSCKRWSGQQGPTGVCNPIESRGVTWARRRLLPGGAYNSESPLWSTPGLSWPQTAQGWTPLFCSVKFLRDRPGWKDLKNTGFKSVCDVNVGREMWEHPIKVNI